MFDVEKWYENQQSKESKRAAKCSDKIEEICKDILKRGVETNYPEVYELLSEHLLDNFDKYLGEKYD
jgi:hypothetical protein